jgi:citronellol/citronellal dehydrogenase
VKNLLGGNDAIRRSRTDEIMGDAAYIILNQDSHKNTGNYYIVILL